MKKSLITILYVCLSLYLGTSQSIFEQSVDINYDCDDSPNLTLRNLDGFPTLKFNGTTNIFGGIDLYYYGGIDRFIIRDNFNPNIGLRIDDATANITWLYWQDDSTI